MADLHVTRKDLAECWGCHLSLVDRVLDNRHPLTDDKLNALPRPLRVLTLRLALEAEGELTGRRAALAHAIIGIATALNLDEPKRMLRMDLDAAVPQKVRA